jgi:F0F1-type ATP synthase epsilon subunit
MADGTFTLRVFSGRGLEIEAAVRSVTVPADSGEVGFLADHCDYVGLLGTGLAVYETTTDSGSRKCLVSGGISTFANNVLTLLADTVDNPEALDTAPLKEDAALLKLELEKLSLFDPEWEILSNKVARLEALKTLVAGAAK